MDNPFAIGTSTDGTYVWARDFRQPYTAELALKVASELVPLGRRTDASGCLIDIRGTSSVSSVIDKYEFAFDKATSADLPLHWRYAFVIDAGDQSPDFIEIVMKNAGYDFSVFEDEDVAVAWLKRQST